MPLYPYGVDNIRKNLEDIRDGKKIKITVIGHLTDEQLLAINEARVALDLSPIVAEVVFAGGHVYRSRVEKDGYSIDEVVEQIARSMDESAVVNTEHGLTTMQNLIGRADNHGNTSIKEQAVLECSARHPRPELFSVVPKGDKNKPKKPELK